MQVGIRQRDGFGPLLQRLRTSRGLTQEQLAETSGSSVRTIREMERGRVGSPRRRTVELLADALVLGDADRAHFLGQARVTSPPVAASSGPVPSELPAAVPTLVGRDVEVTMLARLTDEVTGGNASTASVIVLHGPPGVGTTSLAVAAGHRIGVRAPTGNSSSTCADRRTTVRSTRPTPWPGCCGRSACPRSGYPGRRSSAAGCSAPSPGTAGCSWWWTASSTRRSCVRCCPPAGAASPWSPACRPLTGLSGVVRVPLGELGPADAWWLLASIAGVDRLDADPTGTAELVVTVRPAAPGDPDRRKPAGRSRRLAPQPPRRPAPRTAPGGSPRSPPGISTSGPPSRCRTGGSPRRWPRRSGGRR